MATLASRNLTAVDSAPVTGAAMSLPRMPDAVVATFSVSVTGAPSAFDMRAAVEASLDDGATWAQVVRFADLTAAGARVARSHGSGAAVEAPFAGSALGWELSLYGGYDELAWQAD
jgi:hypothetical protein